MERKEIHLQISAIIEKISYLNENLREEKTLHTVEMDLMKMYASELQELVQQLNSAKPILAEDSVNIKAQEEAVDESAIENRESTEEVEISTDQNSENELEQLSPQLDDHDGSYEIERKEPHQEIDEEEVQLNDDRETDNDNVQEQDKASNPSITAESFETEEEAEKASLNEKFKMDSLEIADKLKFGERKNLKDKIDLNERYIFIQELFEGDSEHFNKSLKELDECISMEQAQDYIKNVVEVKYSWQEKQKHATRFIELVLNNFSEVNNN